VSELENNNDFKDFIDFNFEAPKIHNLKEKIFRIGLKEDTKNKGKFTIEISWNPGKHEPFLRNVGTEKQSKEDIIKIINKFLKENL
jgi:hypothetical protein